MSRKSVIRKLLALISAVSLLLTISTWWVSTGVGMDRSLAVESVGQWFFTYIADGRIHWFNSVNQEVAKGVSVNWRYTTWKKGNAGFTIPQKLGLVMPTTNGLTSPVTLVVLPLWIPAVFMLIVTIFLGWPIFRRTKKGHCALCGYDLRGIDSGRCPECGQRILVPPRLVASFDRLE